MLRKKRILLTGGGSGGHIMPNLAIVSALESGLSPDCHRIVNKLLTNGLQMDYKWPGVELLYIGSRAKMDRELVEAAGIKFKAIFTGKLRRYFSFRNFSDPFLVIMGFFQSLWILIHFWPDVVFSKGGFVSLPVVFAAFILRRPIILHEADSVMGLANRIASVFAVTICLSFPVGDRHACPLHNKYIFTGNPIRTEIKNGNPEEGYRLTGLRREKPVLLVWGGSQGAAEINEMIVREFFHLKHIFQIIHITGKGKRTAITDPDYIQYEYLGEELKHIYAITSAVVGRGGANSLYELAFMQKPNIIIPIQKPDQVNNAEYFESQGAGIVLRNKPLHEVLNALWHNPDKIKSMKEALGRIARPEAAHLIAKLILDFSNGLQVDYKLTTN